MKAADYDAIAAWYANRVRQGGAGDWTFPVLLDVLGDIHSQHICDLGCGEGRVSRLLAQRGAYVVGVDLSSSLIEIALGEGAAHPLGICYRVDDAESLDTIPDTSFDGVVCCLALMDFASLAATFHAVWLILKPGGWFTFLITHPCFAAPHARLRAEPGRSVCWEIQEYFSEGYWRSEDSGYLCARIGAQHRMLSTYLNELVGAGFNIARVVEPQPRAPAPERNAAYTVVPLLLLVRCVKTGTNI